MLRRSSRLLVRLPKCRRPRERPWEIFNVRDFGYHEGSQNYMMWLGTAVVFTSMLAFEVYQQIQRKLASSTLTLPKQGAKQQQWSPYQDNGGTTAAIAGKDFVILAGDTRLNGDYCLHSRHDQSKIFQLTPYTYMASNGMQADRLQLQQMLKYRVKWYQYNNGGRVPPTKAIAQLMSTMLYHRRFFPYYTFNIYDAGRLNGAFLYGTRGSAASFLEPNAFTGAAERDIYTGDSVSFFIITKDGVQRESFELRKD
ncbi:Proteasome subunit family protein [Leishmania donovani]|uniref:Proteasome subunit beta n=1 Tax=Leishmania donovani TaxID=5661 RepID=A0A504X9U9_LEIDO|nr:Proteasome subunit family protein [Leishmania donovani]